MYKDEVLEVGIHEWKETRDEEEDMRIYCLDIGSLAR